MTSNGPIESHAFKLIIQAVEVALMHISVSSQTVSISRPHIEYT